MPGSFTSLLLPGTGIIKPCRVPASYSEMNNSEKMWQTEMSSRVVWLCPVLPLVTRARAYRSQTWSSELVFDLPILWSPLLPSPVRLLCFQLQSSSNLFANKKFIVKRCHSKEKQKTIDMQVNQATETMSKGIHKSSYKTMKTSKFGLQLKPKVTSS